MIEVLSGPAPSQEIPAVEVSSYPSPLDPVFNVSRVCAYVREGQVFTVRDVVPACRMSLETATGAALLYAEKMGLCRIYVQAPIGAPMGEPAALS